MSLQVAEPPARVDRHVVRLPAVRNPLAIARVIRRLYPQPVEVIDRDSDLRFHAVYTDDGVRVTDMHGDRMMDARYVVRGWHGRTDTSATAPAPAPGSFAHYLGTFLDDVARRLPRPSPGYARIGARQETVGAQATSAETPTPTGTPAPVEAAAPVEVATPARMPAPVQTPALAEAATTIGDDTPRVDATEWDQAFSQAVHESLAVDALARAAARPTTPVSPASPASPPATRPAGPARAGAGIAFRRTRNAAIRFEHEPVGEVDPITGHAHEPGESIVVCARCDTAYEPGTVDDLRQESNRCITCGYSFRSRRPIRTTFTLTSGPPGGPPTATATMEDAASMAPTTQSQQKPLFRRITEGTVDPLTGASHRAGAMTQRCTACGATYSVASVRAIRREDGDCVVCERRLRVTSALPGVSEPSFGRPTLDVRATRGPTG